MTFLLSYSHVGLYGFHFWLYRNPCIWLVRSSVSSVTWERFSWEFIKVRPIFDFGKKCLNRNTTTPTFLWSCGHFDLGMFRQSVHIVGNHMSQLICIFISEFHPSGLSWHTAPMDSAMLGETIPPFIVKSSPGVKTQIQLVVDSGKSLITILTFFFLWNIVKLV